MQESVTAWAEGVQDGEDDAASVVASELFDVEDLAGYFDTAVDVSGVRPVGGLSVQDVLGPSAVATQRLGASELHRRFVRGRVHRDVAVGVPQPRVQRVVRLEEMIEVNSIDDSLFYDRLRSGRVVARLRGKTGIGKTRRLAGRIAMELGARVLQLELDANMAREAQRAQHEAYGLEVSHYRWPRSRRSFLSVLTYEDFFGYMSGRTRDSVFSTFEYFVFDEAHAPLWEVQCATQCFANFSKGNSLLVMSATVAGADGLVSKGLTGGCKVLEAPHTLEKAMASGKLVSDWLRDRTILLVPDNDSVYQAKAYYEEAGVDVFALDTASLEGEKRKACEFLAAASAMTPRVLVAHHSYGTSYNFPLSYVITTATVSCYEPNEQGALVLQRRPLQEGELLQQRGRVGRSMASASGALVLSPEVGPDRMLRKSEVAAYYASLVACDIMPKHDGLADIGKWFPFGLTRDTARTLQNVSSSNRLPAMLAIRYFAEDGKVARKYWSAVRAFSQPDVDLPRSKYDEPVGMDLWVEEVVGRYYPGHRQEADEVVRVPFASPEGLKVVMHAISAMAEGKLSLPVWWCPGEDEVSEDEYEVERPVAETPVRAVPFRLVTQSEREVASEQGVVGWSFNVSKDDQYVKQKRNAMSWMQTDRGAEAAELLKRRFLGYDEVGDSFMKPGVSEVNVEGTVEVPLPDVVAHTPGGTGVVKVKAGVYALMAAGKVLPKEEAVSLLTYLDANGVTAKFAKTTAFDGWAPTWFSVWGTLASHEVMRYATERGVHSVALALGGAMYERFREEAVHYLVTSGVYRDKVRSFFSKSVSQNKLARLVREGKVPIAQSDLFVAQWLKMLDMYDSVLRNFERVGVFDPLSVVKASNRMALDSRSHRRVVSVPDQSLTDLRK